MHDSGPRPGGQPALRTTADVQALIAAERAGQPFLSGRTEDHRQSSSCCRPLEGLTIGVPFLTVVGALLALLGVDQRLREYR